MFNLNMKRFNLMQVKMCIRIVMCVFINYHLKIFKIFGECTLSIQNPVTCKCVMKKRAL